MGRLLAVAKPKTAEGPKTFGDFVRLIRAHWKGGGEDMDQTAFAMKLGLSAKSQPTIARWEANQRLPDAKALLALRNACRDIGAGVSSVHLLYLWLEAQGLDAFVDDLKRGRT